jgi:hypothetical protein
VRLCSTFSFASRYLFLIQFEILCESSLLSLLDTSTSGASVLIVVRSDMSVMLLSIKLCPSFPPLLIDVPLAPAVAFDPIAWRGEPKEGNEGGEESSFLRDKRHRFFFSFSLGVSGMGISVGTVASSSTWSRSDPSLKELCSDVGGDFLDFNGT